MADQFSKRWPVGDVLHADGALAGRRHQHLRADALTDARLEAKPRQAGASQHQGVEVARVETAEAGLDIPAHRRDVQGAVQGGKHRPPAQTGRAEAGARGQIAESRVGTARNERVADVRARAEGAQGELFVERRWHVLHAVDGDVGATVQQGALQRVDERALAGHRLVGCRGQIAAGGDFHALGFKAGRDLAQPRRHGVGLGQGEAAAARGDAQSFQDGLYT